MRGQNSELQVDLALVMEGFEFETVWRQRRVFKVERVEIPVARLAHIVASKAAAGRPKDVLFLATHEEVFAELAARIPEDRRQWDDGAWSEVNGSAFIPAR